MIQKPLEDVLRALAKSYRLNHVSIAWTERGWETAYRGVAGDDHRMVTHEDVACSLRAALTGRAGDAPPPPPKTIKPRTTKAAEPVAHADDVFGDLM